MVLLGSMAGNWDKMYTRNMKKLVLAWFKLQHTHTHHRSSTLSMKISDTLQKNVICCRDFMSMPMSAMLGVVSLSLTSRMSERLISRHQSSSTHTKEIISLAGSSRLRIRLRVKTRMWRKTPGTHFPIQSL